MARGYEVDVFEDDACLNCGETHYTESKVPGLCVACYDHPVKDVGDLFVEQPEIVLADTDYFEPEKGIEPSGLLDASHLKMLNMITGIEN